MRLTFILVFFLQAAFLSANSAITYGTTVISTIDELGETEIFTFNGTIGDRIYIRMRDAETPIDACFTLLDPAGNVIDDPCGNGGIVYIKDYQLTMDGTYQIITKDAGDNDTGNYGLALMKLNSPSYATPIPCDFDATETLEKTVEVKTYTFSAEAHDKVLVRMRGVNPHIESEVELYNAAGDLLARDAGGGLSYIDPFEIPSTGEYYLLALDKNGNDLGDYGISLQLLNKNNCTEVIECGNNITNTVDHHAQITSYGLYCSAGDKILFSARNGNSSFESQLFIYDGNGNLVANTEGQSKQVEILTDPLSEGYYQIVYFDKGGNDHGAYGISLQVVRGENCCEGISCSDNQKEATFSTLSAMKSYKFSGAPGTTVSIKATALTESMDPQLTIFDPDGNQIERAFSYKNTKINDLVLESTGEYLVICQDLSGNDLGDIALSFITDGLEPIPNVVDLPIVELNCGGTISPPTAQIPCGPEVVGTTNSNLNFNELGEYEITWVYESASGNIQSQNQLVIVQDVEAPSIICGGALKLGLDENGELWLTEDHFVEMVSDECSGVEYVEISQQFFTCEELGENVITIWVGDRAGNTNSCEVIVSVDDSEGNCSSCDPLPSPWKQHDIGQPELLGSTCYDPNGPTFEITGNGKEVFGYDDQFTFVYQNFCGDADLVARVTNISGDKPYALSGIMMRQSLGPAVRYAGLLATNDHGVYYQARTKPNQYTLYEAHEGAPEVWLKLSRRGNLISGYISEDGVNWELNCEIGVKLGGCYFAGLVVNSNSTDTYNTGTFDNVSLINVDNRAANMIGEGTGTNLARLDQCQFQIANRGDEPDCDEVVEEVIPEIPVYPNPARNFLSVDLEEFAGESIQVRLISRRGNIRYRERFDVSPFVLQLDFQSLNVPSGIYNLQIISSEGTYSKPIVIIDEK